MNTISSITALRDQICKWKAQGLKVAFVPTMGNLHQGHLSLIETAKRHADKVVASIFVNPMQFGANEDLDNYPKTLTEDQNKLKDLGTDLLFTPTAEQIYPKGLDKQCFVEVPEMGNILCGNSRKNHFRGVTTVVNKLFNIVQPDVACFGEKDYQQLFLIKTMVEDLSMPIEVINVATVREDSGLAMSSRNGYLSAEEKAQASALYKSLNDAKGIICEGQRDYKHIKQAMKHNVEKAGMRLDYIDFRDADTLMPATEKTGHILVLIAAYIGSARLIDNIYFKTH